MESKKIEYLVVDTGAFLKDAAIQDLGENVITCQEVINEVTNSRQLRRLVVLPYELQVKDVFPENVHFVTEFSKKTGDYCSLSATDIKVIALTYQLEKQIVGSDHLKSAPETQRTITFQNRPTVDLKDIAGFYIPASAGNVKGENEDGECSAALSEKFSNLQCTEISGDNDKEIIDSDTSECPEEDDSKVENDQLLEEVDPSSVLVKIEEPGSPKPKSDSAQEYDESDEGEESCDSEEDTDDDGGAWITPSNLSRAKKQMNADVEEEKSVKVACITTDFAMQNVLKQIGLNIASVDGRVIKQLRTFILRCYGCFKTTSIMTKVFCPHCGHSTLKRVAVSVEPDGSQKIHINFKKPLSTKGKKYSLPTFQGGKHSNNPIIFADQPMPDQRPTRVAKTKTNILDADYIPGFSPFALRDTTSKSAMLGIRGNQEMKHWMRSNPNGRRKKK
ncbi:RNA-binding protein NOB1 [Thrips palmi]|uniref:RNA-binding protein NOB1 n=1 Tax=Thrips palmi TaxID=161013 RepID=A0A6P8Y3I3_THRPL|nr:RNA-binding protein NOB1 [Thrips palmi]